MTVTMTGTKTPILICTRERYFKNKMEHTKYYKHVLTGRICTLLDVWYIENDDCTKISYELKDAISGELFSANHESELVEISPKEAFLLLN